MVQKSQKLLAKFLHLLHTFGSNQTTTGIFDYKSSVLVVLEFYWAQIYRENIGKHSGLTNLAPTHQALLFKSSQWQARIRKSCDSSYERSTISGR